MRYEARCQLCRYSGKAAWRFLTLAELTAGLKAMAPAAAFLLPVKADLRRKEKLQVGETVQVQVAVELAL